MIIKKIIPGNDSKNTSSFSCKHALLQCFGCHTFIKLIININLIRIITILQSTKIKYNLKKSFLKKKVY